MKNILQVLLKKDIRALLPGTAMFITSGIALFLMCLFGIFSGNGDFTVTALTIFLIATIVSAIYIVIKGANLYRRNLSDEKYLLSIAERGVSDRQLLIGKLLWTFITAAVTVTEYVLFFFVSTVLAEDKILDMKNDIQKLSKVSVTNAGEAILSYLSILAAVFVLTALVYLAFKLCYKYFIRGKHALIASLMTTFCMFWITYKIFDIVVPESGLMSLFGTCVYCVAAGVLFTVIHLLVDSKNNKTTDN